MASVYQGERCKGSARARRAFRTSGRLNQNKV